MAQHGGDVRARVPAIDEEVTGRELDPQVRRELSTLAGPVAGTVARHLVMAGRLLDVDPEMAHRHAQAARQRAGRVAVVREAAGHAAYAAGHYDVALSEFRAARRISGQADFLPVMADCERGVGRPDRALALAEDPQAAQLPIEEQAELAIVTAGALRDLGRDDEALDLLRRAVPARPPQAQWVARLNYALGDLLASTGRTEEAVSAFAAAEAGDVDGSLDAGDRVVELLGT
jgi:tetratricopeptide (TPR) repeat protein